MKNVLQIFVLLLLTIAGNALADGKLFWSEMVPPRIPYQRAIILFHEGQETLVLQSRFDATGNSKTNATFGWVVPVPSVPELASTNAWAAQNMFRQFDRASSPAQIEVLPIIFDLVSMLCVLVVLGGLLFFVIPPLRPLRSKYASLFRFGFCGFFICLFMGMLLPAFFSAGGAGGGVEVLRSAEVGIYDAKVIKANDSSGLIAWLNENGFRFGSTDMPVVEQYIRGGWCFVVARNKEGSQLEEVYEKAGYLMDPLVLTFRAEHAIYPLALTSTIGANTEVLIYLLADQKMACNKRLPLLFAGSHRFSRFAGRDTFVDAVFAGRVPHTPVYLTKFKGTFTPAQMQQDLVFMPAKDNEPYRAYVVVPW